MNYFKEFSILCMCLMLGVITRNLINFPIPEAVYGMIYLFIALKTGLLATEEVKKTSDGILQNLALLFVPVGVGIMNSYDAIKGKAILTIVLIALSTAITMGVTGKIIEILQRRKDV